MARQAPSDVRRFRRAAENRLREAEYLLSSSSFYTAAVYLAGYAVECALKALVLFSEPRARHAATLGGFRGVKAHDFEWLRNELFQRHFSVPGSISERLAGLNWWSTDLRYEPSEVDKREAFGFIADTRAILSWAKGRWA